MQVLKRLKRYQRSLRGQQERNKSAIGVAFAGAILGSGDSLTVMQPECFFLTFASAGL